MEASYKYEVYFECPNMDSERIRKLEKYFQITRKSGGGECGRLEVFKGNVYKIAFKDQNVQQRVLEKRDHVSSQFPSIIVHGTPQFVLHDLSTVKTTTPKADDLKAGLSSPPATEFPVAASPSPPIVQNQEVHLESLKEASVARQHLEEELLSIGSPNQLQLDKDRVIVSGTGQVQPDGDGFKHWEYRKEQGVDKVKERPSQADMVDIVSHMQGQPAEIQRASLSDQPAPRYYTGPAAREAQGAKGSHSYVLPRGVRVLVCHGDITKETADALVNAANGNLNHAGGVAAALSWAGGFEVQRESTALVKEHGPYATGDAVMTTGGNLKCRKLIHIVGPIQGEANGQERPLITRSVGSALKLADYNQFRSIAIPCISSGIFQVPISVCAEAIVTAVLHFGRQSQYLKTITLIDTREEVVKALHVACDRIFSSANAELEAAGDRQFQESTGASGPSIQLKTMEGFIEEQQVDVIVLPMKDHDPHSTGLGKRMSEIIGPRLEAAFQKRGKECQLPVEVDVDGLMKLHCRKVFFVNLLPWDREHSETAVQALKQGFQHVLTSCQKQGFGSIAFPKLGTGEVLQFPWHVVESALVKEIGTHELNRHSWPLKIHIVVHPSDSQTYKAKTRGSFFFFLSGIIAVSSSASFSGYASTNLKMATAMVGGVQFELFHGDIVCEKTDVIVNTIQKYADQSGVSKAILKAAGTHVKDEFGACSQQSDILFSTGPGLLECKEIFHGTFYNDAKTICKTCENILKRCEYDHYSSVSFPALGTGAGQMDHDKACNAMLDGIEAAVRSMSPTYLKLVRIVVMRKPVYKDFRTVLQYRCDETARQQQGQDAIRQPPPAVSDWEFIGSSSGHVSQYSNLYCSIF
ncbi:unnamed protein product [Lota lota]